MHLQQPSPCIFPSHAVGVRVLWSSQRRLTQIFSKRISYDTAIPAPKTTISKNSSVEVCSGFKDSSCMVWLWNNSWGLSMICGSWWISSSELLWIMAPIQFGWSDNPQTALNVRNRHAQSYAKPLCWMDWMKVQVHYKLYSKMMIILGHFCSVSPSLFCIDCWCSSKSLLHLASVMLCLYTKMHPRLTVLTHSSNVSQVTIRLPTKDHLALWPSDSPAFYIYCQPADGQIFPRGAICW